MEEVTPLLEPLYAADKHQEGTKQAYSCQAESLATPGCCSQAQHITMQKAFTVMALWCWFWEGCWTKPHRGPEVKKMAD
jgi:hypothetical protein